MIILKLLTRFIQVLSVMALFFLLSGCTTKKTRQKLKVGQNNAVWAESIYLRGYNPTTGEKLSPDHIVALSEQLTENGIKYVYLFAGPYGADGHLPPYSFSPTAINSVRLLQRLNPDLTVLPWIGGIENRTVHLNDSLWVQNALTDTKMITELLGYKGVHIDFEYIVDFDPFSSTPQGKENLENYGRNVNIFHRKLRKLLPKAFISSVVVSTSNLGKPWKRKTTISELTELTKYIDQLNFLFYDTSIKDQETFELSSRELLHDIKFLKERQRNVQYLISIGTFINQPELHHYRNLEIENISNTISTIKKSIAAIDTNTQFVDGLSVYCQWETDEDEWEEIRENWSARF